MTAVKRVLLIFAATVAVKGSPASQASTTQTKYLTPSSAVQFNAFETPSAYYANWYNNQKLALLHCKDNVGYQAGNLSDFGASNWPPVHTSELYSCVEDRTQPLYAGYCTLGPGATRAYGLAGTCHFSFDNGQGGVLACDHIWQGTLDNKTEVSPDEAKKSSFACLNDGDWCYVYRAAGAPGNLDQSKVIAQCSVPQSQDALRPPPVFVPISDRTSAPATLPSSSVQATSLGTDSSHPPLAPSARSDLP